MIVTDLKHPWSTPSLCMAIRVGKIKSTPKMRHIAKQVTFHEVYSTRGSLVPMNRDYNQHLVNYDNANLFLARTKKCVSCRQYIPLSYPCNEQGCVYR